MRPIVFSTILLFLIISSSVAQPENPGPRQAGWTQQTLQRSGRSLSCRIYYPSFVEGSEAQIDTVNGLYPIIAFGHGFAMQTGYYLSLFRHLATHGYIVIAPQFPDTRHDQLAEDLLYCVSFLRAQSSTPSSRFFQLVDTASVGLSGHSMGGGASLLAAAQDSHVAVVAPLAAAETTPSAIAVMNRIAGVVYLIAGGSDGITPPAAHQIPMYNNARSLKALPIIQQANHTRFMDVATFDFIDPNGTLTRPQQLLITRRYLTSVFNLVLRRDPSYWTYAFGDSAMNDLRLHFTRHLRSLFPLPFTLVAPQGIVSSMPLRCIWRRTMTLNPGEQIRYTLHLASSQALSDTILLVRDIADTSYVVLQSLVAGRNYYWRVVARSSDSTATFSSQTYQFTILTTPVREDIQPNRLTLYPNYPNPFNPTTTFRFELAQPEWITLKIVDLLGRERATLVSGRLERGVHEVQWNATTGESGVYFAQLQSPTSRSLRRAVLVK
jgi:dienelactone hydrolase